MRSKPTSKNRRKKPWLVNYPSPAPVYIFDTLVNEVWIPVRDDSHRPATVAMYTNILKVILPQFKGVPLAEISGVRISQYLRRLRNDYRKPDGKPLAEQSICARLWYTDFRNQTRRKSVWRNSSFTRSSPKRGAVRALPVADKAS